jgi:hypothetical protein
MICFAYWGFVDGFTIEPAIAGYMTGSAITISVGQVLSLSNQESMIHLLTALFLLAAKAIRFGFGGYARSSLPCPRVVFQTFVFGPTGHGVWVDQLGFPLPSALRVPSCLTTIPT